MQLYLLRHAQSQANVANQISCRPPGSPLSPAGIAAAEALARSSAFSHLPLDAVYTSPFLRTTQTYAILRRRWPMLPAPIIDDRLKELDYGQFEGRDIAEIESDLQKSLALVSRGNLLTRVGRDGENEYEVRWRIFTFMAELLHQHHNDQVLLVSHAGVLSIIRRLVADIDTNNPKTTTTDTCTLYHYDLHEVHLAAIKLMTAKLFFDWRRQCLALPDATHTSTLSPPITSPREVGSDHPSSPA